MNQVVVGTFVGTFVYSSAREPFVPGIAVTAGVAFGVAAIGLLLVFVHHMARSIQVSSSSG